MANDCFKSIWNMTILSSATEDEIEKIAGRIQRPFQLPSIK